MSTKSPRRRSREFALQALYQWQLAQPSLGDLEKQFTTMEGFDRADAKLFDTLLSGVMKHHAAYEQALATHLDRGWADVSPVEKAILLIGAHELIGMPETPYRVAINEAIELGKTFGGTDGHKYVNGILDRLAGAVRGEEIAFQGGDARPAARAKKPVTVSKKAPVVIKKAPRSKP